MESCLHARRTNSCPSFSWSTKLCQSHSQPTLREKKYKQVNQYLILCKLGEGSFSKVYLCKDQLTQKYYAMKRVLLKTLSKSNLGVEQLQFEIDIMQKLKHPNIVSLHEVISVPTEKAVYIVIEYANCGNLSSILDSDFKFSPKQIQNIFAQIVSGVSFIHENLIVHQDLKPANILLKSDGSILITDFGIGRSIQNAAKVVGTPAYQAPEVISDSNNNYENEVKNGIDSTKEDVWSLGVTLYELSFNKLPYDGQNVFEIVRSITNTNAFENIPLCDPLLLDLLQKMLTIDPRKRITISEIMKHPYYLNAMTDKESICNINMFVPPKIDNASKIEKVEGKVFEHPCEFFKSNMHSIMNFTSVLMN